ncbi:MAG: T9SS type A sorting domain-containing protein [candidate division WOR-3 bacterium]|nr:MAG: T9SS type A sorting domain-containing protein [candidate division WOR-3 bacterium]
MKHSSRRPRVTLCLMLACGSLAGIAAGIQSDNEWFERLMEQRTPRNYRPIPFAPPPSLPGRHSYVPAQAGVDSAIRDDFLVNDETSGGTKQNGPVVVSTPNGGFVIGWYDFRDGNCDCWFQRFNSSAGKLGTNRRVNTDPTMRWQSDPAIAAGDDGRFVLSWEDRRIFGNSDVFCRRYDASGNPIGSEFRVGDSAPDGDQLISGIHMAPNRSFFVAWDDRRYGITGDIYGQFLDSGGTRVDTNFRVNDDPIGVANQYEPAVSGDDSGRYVVAWMDGRGVNPYDWNIFVQRFDASGNRLGANTQVTTNDSVQWSPWVASAPAGSFIVTWDDRRKGPGDFDVYARFYDHQGQPASEELRVNDDAGVAVQFASSAAANRYGEFLVVWADTRNGDEDTYAQMFTPDGDPIGGNFRVSSGAATGNQGVPSVAARPDGGFVVAWADFREGNYDIYAQRVSRDRTLVGDNFRVNGDSASSHQRASSIAMDAGGRFIVSWEDERDPDINVYCRVYDSQGNERGPSLKLNDDPGPASQYYTAAAAGRDRFLVTWTDGRNDFNIYGQLVDTLGMAIGSNFVVNNEPGEHLRWYSYSAMDDSNRSITVWRDGRPPAGYKIYGRRFDGSGNPLGSDFQVPESVGPPAIFASVSANSWGRFVVSWMDYRDTTDRNPDIYCRVFGSDGSPLTGDIRVDTDAGDYFQGYPSCAMAEDGGFAVCWEDTRREAYDVYLQWFDSTGAKLGDNVIVKDGPIEAECYGPTCAFGPDGRLVVVFNDERSEPGSPDVWGQLYLADRTPHGSNTRICNRKLFPGNARWNYGSSVAVSANTVASAWTDNRRHLGWDIYAKLMDWGLVGIEEMPAGQAAERILVRPTVSSGLVRLLIPGGDVPVRVRVFDPVGRQVHVQEQPHRSAELDLRNLSAGVYVIAAERQDGTSLVRRKVVLR